MLLTSLPNIIPKWQAPANVLAFSTTTQGGVSTGPYASLNLGLHVNDKPQAVRENRARLQAYLRQQNPHIQSTTWLNQVHQNHVHELHDTHKNATENFNDTHKVFNDTHKHFVSDTHNFSEMISADAVYTRLPNTPCCVMTADCLALFICNQQGTEIAAVHAGWRGLLDGVIENAIDKFLVSPEQLRVAFAPSISQRNFEVGSDVAEQFSTFMGVTKVSVNSGKYFVDLQGAAVRILQSMGVMNIALQPMCTYEAPNLFSHRRISHQGAANCGRMANLIMIKS